MSVHSDKLINFINSTLEDAFRPLIGAFIESYAVILLGCLAGKWSLISENNHWRLQFYLTQIALPAIIFHSMCTLDFGTVNWMFLTSVFVGKTTLFVMVALVTVSTEHPTNWSKVGLYAIVATQSNDFALCYPLVTTIFGNKHPDFVHYLFLVAPISFMLLNPIGFALLELGKWQSVVPNEKGTTSWREAVKKVFIGVALNPLVFMTVIGVGCNLLLGSNNIPHTVTVAFKVVGSTFLQPALFYLGLTMVQSSFQLKSLLVPSLLIASKMLVLPLLIYGAASYLLTFSGLDQDLLRDFLCFGFLYATTPSAPTVCLYASQYTVALQEVSTALVAGTAFAAPLMFVSTKLIEKFHWPLIWIFISILTTLFIIALIFCPHRNVKEQKRETAESKNNSNGHQGKPWKLKTPAKTEENSAV